MSSDSVTAAATSSLSRPAIENAQDGNDPSIPSAAYQRSRARWEKCRACFIGTEAIRAGGKDFLVQYGAESDEDYAVRQVLAAFYNAFKRTALASVGMILADGVTLGEDVPEPIVTLAENIDARGTHLNVFARRLTTAGVVDGFAGIMVEHSKSDEAAAKRLSGDEEKRAGLRPYFLLFRADDVFKPLYETINGVETLVLLILREVVTERVGLFGTRSVTKYRIYTNENGVIKAQVWRSPDTTGGRPTIEQQPTTITNQTEIPWSPLEAGDEIAEKEYLPPLMDLADLNIQYHNSLTNHLSLEALAYVPTPVRIGAQVNADGEYPDLTLGPRNTIEAPAMAGVSQPIYWLSPPVDVLDAGERTLAATKADMGTMGAAFMSSETRAAETAEGKRMDSSASRATLGTVATAVKDCLEGALGFMGKYLNVEGGSVTVNDDFTGEGIDPTLAAVMVTAYQAELFTAEELRHFLHTGQLPENFSADDLTQLFAEQRAKEDLAASDPNANPSPPGTFPSEGLEIIRDPATQRATGVRRAQKTA